MAFQYLKFSLAVVMLLFCFLVMEEASGCNNGHGCFYEVSHEIENRKVLAGKEREGFMGGAHMHGASSNTGNGRNVVGWELRKVPSGPDPLHHNGHGPKKPQTP